MTIMCPRRVGPRAATDSPGSPAVGLERWAASARHRRSADVVRADTGSLLGRPGWCRVVRHLHALSTCARRAISRVPVGVAWLPPDLRASLLMGVKAGGNPLPSAQDVSLVRASSSERPSSSRSSKSRSKSSCAHCPRPLVCVPTARIPPSTNCQSGTVRRAVPNATSPERVQRGFDPRRRNHGLVVPVEQFAHRRITLNVIYVLIGVGLIRSAGAPLPGDDPHRQGRAKVQTASHVSRVSLARVWVSATCSAALGSSGCGSLPWSAWAPRLRSRPDLQGNLPTAPSAAAPPTT